MTPQESADPIRSRPMNADAVAALPWGEYIAKLAATPCLAFREPWSCLNEPEEDGSPEAPMWERDELCPPCLVRAARAALAAAPLPSEPDSCDGLCSVTHEHALPSDTPADGLDVERLTRALWVVEFEAEEGPYEHASEANVIDVTDLAEAIAREYAALALTQEPRSGDDR